MPPSEGVDVPSNNESERLDNGRVVGETTGPRIEDESEGNPDPISESPVLAIWHESERDGSSDDVNELECTWNRRPTCSTEDHPLSIKYGFFFKRTASNKPLLYWSYLGARICSLSPNDTLTFDNLKTHMNNRLAKSSPKEVEEFLTMLRGFVESGSTMYSFEFWDLYLKCLREYGLKNQLNELLYQALCRVNICLDGSFNVMQTSMDLRDSLSTPQWRQLLKTMLMRHGLHPNSDRLWYAYLENAASELKEGTDREPLRRHLLFALEVVSILPIGSGGTDLAERFLESCTLEASDVSFLRDALAYLVQPSDQETVSLKKKMSNWKQNLETLRIVLKKSTNKTPDQDFIRECSKILMPHKSLPLLDNGEATGPSIGAKLSLKSLGLGIDGFLFMCGICLRKLLKKGLHSKAGFIVSECFHRLSQLHQRLAKGEEDDDKDLFLRAVSSISSFLTDLTDKVKMQMLYFDLKNPDYWALLFGIEANSWGPRFPSRSDVLDTQNHVRSLIFGTIEADANWLACPPLSLLYLLMDMEHQNGEESTRHASVQDLYVKCLNDRKEKMAGVNLELVDAVCWKSECSPFEEFVELLYNCVLFEKRKLGLDQRDGLYFGTFLAYYFSKGAVDDSARSPVSFGVGQRPFLDRLASICREGLDFSLLRQSDVLARFSESFKSEGGVSSVSEDLLVDALGHLKLGEGGAADDPAGGHDQIGAHELEKKDSQETEVSTDEAPKNFFGASEQVEDKKEVQTDQGSDRNEDQNDLDEQTVDKVRLVEGEIQLVEEGLNEKGEGLNEKEEGGPSERQEGDECAQPSKQEEESPSPVGKKRETQHEPNEHVPVKKGRMDHDALQGGKYHAGRGGGRHDRGGMHRGRGGFFQQQYDGNRYDRSGNQTKKFHSHEDHDSLLGGGNVRRQSFRSRGSHPPQPPQHDDTFSLDANLVQALLPSSSDSGIFSVESSKSFQKKSESGNTSPVPPPYEEPNDPSETIAQLEHVQKNLLLRHKMSGGEGGVSPAAPPASSSPPYGIYGRLNPLVGPRYLEPIAEQLSEILKNDSIFNLLRQLESSQKELEADIERHRHELLSQQQQVINAMHHSHQTRLINAPPHRHPQILQMHEIEKRDIEARLRQELDNFEKNVNEEMSKKITEQQIILQSANVPGFMPTNDPKQLAIQHEILNLIIEAGKQKSQADRQRYPVTTNTHQLFPSTNCYQQQPPHYHVPPPPSAPIPHSLHHFNRPSSQPDVLQLQKNPRIINALRSDDINDHEFSAVPPYPGGHQVPPQFNQQLLLMMLKAQQEQEFQSSLQQNPPPHVPPSGPPPLIRQDKNNFFNPHHRLHYQQQVHPNYYDDGQRYRGGSQFDPNTHW